jgi:hypothetical protein
MFFFIPSVFRSSNSLSLTTTLFYLFQLFIIYIPLSKMKNSLLALAMAVIATRADSIMPAPSAASTTIVGGDCNSLSPTYRGECLKSKSMTIPSAKSTITIGGDCESLGPVYKEECLNSKSMTSPSATPTIVIGGDCESLGPAYQEECLKSKGMTKSTVTSTQAITISSCAPVGK